MNRSRRDDPQDDVHVWALKRMAPFAAGLLNEAEEETLRDHLEICEPCSECLRLVVEAPFEAEDGSHIPAAIMATWVTASGLLRGLERAMVQRHLERCADCRGDLAVLGFEPVLAPAADLAGAEPRPWADRRKDRERNRWLAGEWKPWLLGGWATTATAAALALLILRNPAPVAERDLPVGPAETREIAVVSDPGLAQPPPISTPPKEPISSRGPSLAQSSRLALTVVVAATGTTRGAGPDQAEPQPTPLPRPGETLTLRIPDPIPDYPADSPTWIMLIGPDGSAVAQMKTMLADLHGQTVISFIPGQKTPSPGAYTLRIRILPSNGAPADSVASQFLMTERSGD
jgi:hypothetical protein